MTRIHLCAAAIAGVLVVSAAAARSIDQNIKSYVCQRLDDCSLTAVVGKADQRELGKISKDFGFLYRFKTVSMRYKEPNKVRIEAAVEGSRGIYIFNGTKQYVRVPKLRLNTVREYADQPGKRKSLMDMGLVSEYYLSYVDAKFIREGSVDGMPVAVFEMRYKDRGDTSHHVVYIDPVTKTVRKRDSYSQTGQLQAVYFFRDVKQVAPGVWFPTRIEVQNTDRVIAGVTTYRDIVVNGGLDDKLFE